MTKALKSLRQSARAELPSDYEINTTHIYVKFLPKSEDHLDILSLDEELILYTYPLDREIVRGGSYYIDPNAPKDKPTPLYATVRVDFELPKEVPHEKLIKLHNPQETEDYDIIETNNKYDNQFIASLVNESFRLTGHHVQEKSSTVYAKRYTPSGTIKTYDSTKSSYVGIAGLKVRIRGGLFTQTQFTDDNGYFKSRRSYSRSVYYAFNFERHDFMIRTPGRSNPEGVSTSRSRGPLRLNFSESDIRSYYANIFRAAYHYYHGYIEGLHRPPQNTLLRGQVKIEANQNKHPTYLGTHQTAGWFLGRTS